MAGSTSTPEEMTPAEHQELDRMLDKISDALLDSPSDTDLKATGLVVAMVALMMTAPKEQRGCALRFFVANVNANYQRAQELEAELQIDKSFDAGMTFH